MSISYPLSLPTNTRIRSVEFTAINAVAYSQSPFTFAGQAHAYSGQTWQADVTLPPMRRSDAEQWIAFLVSLRGQFGTFLLNDPIACSPRGTATAAAITGSANDSSVTTAMTGTLLAGDYIQLGSGVNARLHKVLQDQSGSGTLEIWPALRVAQSSVSADLTSAAGAFRLSSNQQSWSVNEASIYGITFAAMEVL
jgi:hypothetical protein